MGRIVKVLTLMGVLIATQLLGVSTVVAQGKVVIYVDDDAAPGGNGSAASPFKRGAAERPELLSAGAGAV